MKGKRMIGLLAFYKENVRPIRLCVWRSNALKDGKTPHPPFFGHPGLRGECGHGFSHGSVTVLVTIIHMSSSSFFTV